jgi:peptidoglycan/LPS O-acetylase OafA/YrhL
LGIAVAGPDAVLLFFVLSGFVLFLPYLRKGGTASYPRFVMKRVCRIYLPYLAALGLVLMADRFCYRPLPGAAASAIPWTRPFPTDAILPHVLFLGPAPIFAFNGAFWSLVHEMRISLAFPVVALLTLRLSLAGGLIAGFGLCAVGLLPLLSAHHTEWATVGYAGLFLVGACMARHMERIRWFAARIGPYGRGLGFLLALVLLKSTHGLPERFKVYAVQATLHGVAVALIVALALTTVHFKALLHVGVLRWLGRVSYSLYLVHDTVLYSTVCLFWKKTAHHGWLVAAGVGASLVLARVFYEWVERPAMLLGRRLGGTEAAPGPVSVSAAVQREL